MLEQRPLYEILSLCHNRKPSISLSGQSLPWRTNQTTWLSLDQLCLFVFHFTFWILILSIFTFWLTAPREQRYSGARVLACMCRLSQRKLKFGQDILMTNAFREEWLCCHSCHFLRVLAWAAAPRWSTPLWLQRQQRKSSLRMREFPFAESWWLWWLQRRSRSHYFQFIREKRRKVIAECNVGATPKAPQWEITQKINTNWWLLLPIVPGDNSCTCYVDIFGALAACSVFVQKHSALYRMCGNLLWTTF